MKFLSVESTILNQPIMKKTALWGFFAIIFISMIQCKLPSSPTEPVIPLVPMVEPEYKGWLENDGWTEFILSDDSRLIYIADDGDDDTAQYYTTTDSIIGPDPFNPVGPVASYKTYAGAAEDARVGYPDWILFKRGDTFQAQITPKSGRSVEDMSLIGAYGASGDMPIIMPMLNDDPDPVIQSCISVFARRGNNLEYAAISSIDFYSATRDPDSPLYSGVEGSDGISMLALGSGDERGFIKHLLIEGCQFRYFTGNVIQSIDEGTISDIIIRRNVILDNYSEGTSHSQGFYTYNADGLLLEENIFDHNGWLNQAPATPGTATMFNHNTYFANSHNVSFVKNISLRPSSIHFKFTANNGAFSATNITVRDNLCVDGEVGFSLGGNYDTPFKFKDVSVTENVLTEAGRSQQTNRTLGWNIGVQDWYGGQVEQNLIIHNSNPSVNNTFGISLNGGSRQVTIANNYIYGLKGSGIIVGSRDPQDREGNIITNNILQDPDSNSRILQVESLEGLSIGDNTYFNEAPSRFSLFSATCTFEEWVELTDDNSAYAEHSFPDPTRSIETYQEYIGEDGTIDSFISACREQNRFNRDQRYAAEEVNQWIRAGFSDSLSN